MSDEVVADEAKVEVTCESCKQWGVLRSMDDNGFLIEHGGRQYPCRVPR